MTSVENHPRIRSWSKNPRYWQHKGQPVLLLGGSREDNLFQISDLEEHLDLLASVGGNYIRNTMSDRDEGDAYPYALLSNGLYDLSQWNDLYWDRFEALLRLTQDRGIIVQIEVWDRFDLSDAKGMYNWQRHPYNPANNVNYSAQETGLADAYPDHPSMDQHPFYHTIPGMDDYEPQYDHLRTFQERYVAKLLAHSLPYGNVLYCMNNETSTDCRWGQHWMTFIKRQAKEAGLDVCVTDMFDDVWKPEKSAMLQMILENPQIYDYLDISQINSRNFGQAHWDRLCWIAQRAQDHPRPLNHTKIYSDGQTDFGSGTPQDGIERFWRNLLCGSASARFHRPTAGLGLNEIAQGCIRAARTVESLVRFWDLQPAMALISECTENSAYLAAASGEAYVLFFTRGGTVQLNLVDVDKPMAMTWVDITTGGLVDAQDVIGGGVTALRAPSDSPWVAVLVEDLKSTW